jgi:hypothetical protein
MASIINASSTGSGGIVQTADASGVLQLQSNGTVALIVDASGYTTIGTAVPSGIKAGNLNVCGTGATGNGWAAQFGNATGSIAVLAGVRSSIASIGTQSATTLSLNPDGGQVITPNRSAFIAYMTATSTATTIPFNATTLNIGSNYNTSTYTYTAPVSGLYFFNLIITYDGTGTNPNAGYIALFVNGTRARDFFEANAAWTTNTELHSSCIYYLNANDAVLVYNSGSGNIQAGGNANYYSLFSGYLIG